MFEKNTLAALTGLLSAPNAAVAAQAAWALSYLPQDLGTINKFISIGGIALISQTLIHEDRAVRAQGALTIGTLAESETFATAIVNVGVALLLVTLLNKAKDAEAQLGAAVAVRSIATNPQVAVKLLASGVGSGLIPLLRGAPLVRSQALAALVPLLAVPAEVSKLLAGDAMAALLWGQNSPGDFSLVSPATFGGSLEASASTFSLRRSQMPLTELSLAKCIRLLSVNDEAKKSFKQASGFPVLVKLAESSEPEVQEEVAWSIGVLASDPESETLLAELGAVRALYNYIKNGTDAVQKRSQWSLGMLTEECLKYNSLLTEREGLDKEAGDDPDALLAGDAAAAPASDEKPVTPQKPKPGGRALVRMATKLKVGKSKTQTLQVEESSGMSGDSGAEPNPIDDAIVDEVEKRRAGEKPAVSPGSASKSNRRFGNTAKKVLGTEAKKARPGKTAAMTAAAATAAMTHTKDVKDLISQMKENEIKKKKQGEVKEEEPVAPPSPKAAPTVQMSLR